MANRNSKALIGITVAVVVGVLVGWAGGDAGRVAGPFSVFALCGLLAYVVNWLAFVPSYIGRTERFYDLTGSIAYLTVTVAALAISGDLDARSLFAGGMVVVWTLRLGSFLFRRIRRDGNDGRFDEIKTDFLRFLMAWTLQGLWVFLTAAAALAIITGSEREPIGWVGVVGIAIWVVGFAIEVVADRQKSAFRREPANRGRFISSGLWAWSRHPNYFGEIVLWAGVAVLAVPVLSGWRWVVLVSPFFVYLLLTRVSGVPMLEARADERWGDDAAYRRYKESTPILVPRPPKG